MSADYAGAVAAIKTKFEAEWVSAPGVPRTRIAQVNKNPDPPWPPRDGANKLQRYVLIAVEGAGSGRYAFGSPENPITRYDGLISIHVFEPVGDGVDETFPLAVLAGEIFRDQKFYNDVTDGCFVWSFIPRIDGGGPGSDDGIWFRVTATIPFGYWHRG